MVKSWAACLLAWGLCALIEQARGNHAKQKNVVRHSIDKSLPVNRHAEPSASPYQTIDALETADAKTGKLTKVPHQNRKKGKPVQVTADALIIDITNDAEASVHPRQSNDYTAPILAGNRSGDKQDKARKTSHSTGQFVGLLRPPLQRGGVNRVKQNKSSRRPPGKVQGGVQAKKNQQATADVQIAAPPSKLTERLTEFASDAWKNADALQASSIIRKTQNWLNLGQKHFQAPVAPAPPAAPPPPAAPAPPAADIYSVIDLFVGMFAFIGLLFCMGTMLHLVFREPNQREFRQQQQQPLPRRPSIAPRLKALSESRRNADQEDRLDLSTLRYNLKAAGIDITFHDSSRGLIDLYNEMQAGNCEVLWVNDPEGGRRLIRLVRLFRGLVTSHREAHGDSVLTEESRTFKSKSGGQSETEIINKPITLKMRLDAVDGLEAGKALLAQRLHLPKQWQKKYMHVVDKAGFSYVEEDISVHYRGLPTWYLIDEWNFDINLRDIPEEDQDILGLPDEQTFTTSDITAEEEIVYSWKWQPRDARSQSYWSKSENQTRSRPLSVDDFANARTEGEIAQESIEQRLSRGRYSIKASRSIRREKSEERMGTTLGITRSMSRRSVSRGRANT